MTPTALGWTSVLSPAEACGSEQVYDVCTG